jgi:hypothetical protein
MARRKQEIALQQEVETNEDWDELLNKEGLIGKNLEKKSLFFLKSFLQLIIFV